MRGKKPKERSCYVLRMEDGTLVEVSRDIYQEWYQSRRRERYQQERDQKYRKCSLNELEEKNICFDRSFFVQEGVEEAALQHICRNKVREALEQLTDSDAKLIELLYFKERTVTDVAEICSCSKKTIRNRRKRILEELCQIMRKQGIRENIFEL